MRTFPRSLATFRKIVEEYGQRLRKLSLEELKRLADQPVEHLTVESRAATIGIIVEDAPDGVARVVVQGFMDTHWFPFGKNVALDGFYKYPDGSVVPMPGDEFYRFG